MIRTASPLPHPPQLHQPSESDTRIKRRPTERLVVYDLPFWLAYASNALAIAAVSLLFRYADFVRLLGGEVSFTEEPDMGNLQVRFCEGH